ncbi:hypothetical protein AAMO2058_001402400 [Amorphochlora amoebiformis]
MRADETSGLVPVAEVVIDDGEPGGGLGFSGLSEPLPRRTNYMGGLDDDDHEGLLEETQAGNDDAKDASVCSLAYYKQFFNISTEQIVSRLLRTLDCRPNSPLFYVEDGKPDMYGPFWVCTTLVFLMAATGNIAHYLSTASPGWRYDVHKLTTAAWIFYSSISIIPISVWFALGHLNHTKSLVEVISIYGYSLFVFIPTCVICVLPNELVRWISICVSFTVSSVFIVKNLGNLVIIRNPDRNRSTKTKGYILLAVILGIHATIALLMKLYFFHYD